MYTHTNNVRSLLNSAIIASQTVLMKHILKKYADVALFSKYMINGLCCIEISCIREYIHLSNPFRLSVLPTPRVVEMWSRRQGLRKE